MAKKQKSKKAAKKQTPPSKKALFRRSVEKSLSRLQDCVELLLADCLNLREGVALIAENQVRVHAQSVATQLENARLRGETPTEEGLDAATTPPA